MRLLFVHERFGALGGAEANAFITAREMKARGHSVALLHGAPTGRGERDWSSTFEICYGLDKAENRSEVTRRALAEFEPELVYVHKMADLKVIETLLDSGVPLIRMVHDHDIYCMRSYKYSYFSRKICTRAASAYCIFPCGGFVNRNHGPGFPLKFTSLSEKKREIALNQRFDRMIVVSEFMKQELIRNGVDPKKIGIYPPIPPAVEASLRSTFSDRNLIIYAGQIIRGKGVDVLLESLALLTVPFECIILGDGSHKAYCEKLARRLRLSDRVHFKGFVPQEELKNYYRECSVVAVSSVWPEPIATIGLEVMRYALPVVAFDAGGIKDWLKDGTNGFLVKWMDRAAFANGIQTLLLDKSLAKEMGERGLEIVNERFNFGQYIENLEQLFEDVIEQKQAAAEKAFLPERPVLQVTPA
jgi:glycosyltransferase involved in cell wall biosynthesis